MSGEVSLDINIKEPRWDQGTFMGRAKHFFTVTDPRNLLLSSETLEAARRVIEDYRTTPAVLFWQWVNQSFNAIVNYTNRSGDAPITVKELKFGIPVTDENGNRLGESKKAAQQAIAQVVVSRIGMAAPAMAIPPVIMNALEKRAFLKRYPWMNAPLQVGLVGLCLVFATPLCCALFPQKSSMRVNGLEPELQTLIREKNPDIEVVYFNKGL
ncbi:hypothetical protein lerEdw1_007910 [Lerista edwardsae]|nr:hypothetical protein lerEdw1_007910 [Lerista edwardsae]